MTGWMPSENQLLRLLDAGTRASIAGLTSVELVAREVLHEPGTPALYAYFPVNCVVSLVATMESGVSAEVGVIGKEGMVGLDGVVGTVAGATSSVVQIPGAAVRAPIASLKAARRSSPAIRRMFDLYGEARFIQVAQTAACNRLHTVEARLARWLLAIDDRIDCDRFTVPHEFIADMLGVRRPTVSTALRGFQESGIVAYRGRAIHITDRRRLETIACECYRVLQREFDRLLGSGATAPDAVAAAAAPVAADDEAEPGLTLETLRGIAGRLLVVSIREQEAREQAELANRSKDQFLAMVSHELRTPLNAILGWCAILATQAAPTRGLQVIEQNARAQLKVVDDLLDAAKLTANTLTIQPAVITLSSLIDGALDTIQPIAAEKQVALRFTLIDEPPAVHVDADRVRQVLLNILTNAVKFTPAGGAIAVSLRTTAGRAQVIIRDTGKGIAADVLPHVFERFRQGPATETGHHGLGLGLTIARVIVELHRGTIELSSPGEGQGTTCTITLPTAAA
jgi:signal transduction histidine kinase